VIDLQTAQDRILAALPPVSSECVPLEQAAARVLATAVPAAVDLPMFDNSAMDGYAVRAADVAGAAAATPVRLQLRARISAGERFAGELRAGECVRVFTGAPVPRGADAVVMQEDTRTEGAEVLVLDSAQPGEHVRLQGEDVRRGAVLAEAGRDVSPGLMGLLAATGIASVEVGRRPEIGLLATGSELCTAGAPLAPGQIYESNRAMLAALVTQAGGVAKVFPLVRDTLAETRTALETVLASCDLVVTSGGVSVGEMDFVKAAFEALGGNLEFWRVAMRPGKPFVFGRRQEKFLFGLPGNPVSAYVTFQLLVRPAVRRWQGARELSLPSHAAVLAEPFSNPGDRPHFVRVWMDAQNRVSSAGKQASHALASLAAGNALLELPPRTHLATGSTVAVLRVG
jgi:molybdopterin molybdotransferase